MKPEDIEIGRLYANSRHPSFVYMGIGCLLNFSQKDLVMISADYPDWYGIKVVPYESNPAFWHGFTPIPGKVNISVNLT